MLALRFAASLKSKLLASRYQGVGVDCMRTAWNIEGFIVLTKVLERLRRTRFSTAGVNIPLRVLKFNVLRDTINSLAVLGNLI